ncbi:hypothetical protein Emed_005920 [Eimeria media]
MPPCLAAHGSLRLNACSDCSSSSSNSSRSRTDDDISEKPLQLYAAGYYNAAAAAAAAEAAAAPANSPAGQQREFLAVACEQQLQQQRQPPHQQQPEQLQQMTQSSNPAIKALGLFLLLTQYGDQGMQRQRLQELQQQLRELAASNATAAFLAAAAAAASNEPLAALQICSSSSKDPQMRALRIQLLLRIHREDLAKTQLESDLFVMRLHSEADAAACTVGVAARPLRLRTSGAYETAEQSISRALCHLWDGEALAAENCLADAETALPRAQGDTSCTLQNARAVCELERGNFVSAYQRLQNLLAIAPLDETTLANLVCCLRLMKRHSEADEISEKLCSAHPKAHFAKQRLRLREAFAVEAFGQFKAKKYVDKRTYHPRLPGLLLHHLVLQVPRTSFALVVLYAIATEANRQKSSSKAPQKSLHDAAGGGDTAADGASAAAARRATHMLWLQQAA